MSSVIWSRWVVLILALCCLSGCGSGALPPVANVGGPYSGFIGKATGFDGSKSSTPGGGALQFDWDFGDGGSGTGATPAHTYMSAGSFTVRLTVTNVFGVKDTATTSVSIKTALPTSNPGGPYVGNVGQIISLDGSVSVGAPGQILVGYAWDFGDGSTGTGAKPTHVYNASGTYTVSLTVTDNAGGSATATTGVTIYALPVADAGGPYAGIAANAISFDGSKSSAPPAQSLSFAWTFGDGSAGTGVKPTHSYTTAGTYTVGLTVSDTSGGSATATATATVSPLPVANAGGPYSGTINQAVLFDGSKSSVATGQTLNYAWTFGDGGSASGASPSHVYTAAATYTVTLTVTGSAGGTASATTTATITTTSPPSIDGFSPLSGSVGSVITLTGHNLMPTSGSAPQIMLNQIGGGTISAPLNTSGATSLSFIIPPGATSGKILLSNGVQTIASPSDLTVTPSSTFSVSATPGTVTLVQGQSSAITINLSSSNGFSGLANLAVTGLPTGITGTFQPSSIAAGQTSVLTVTATTAQAAGTFPINVTAAATVDGLSLTQAASASVKVSGVTTSFLGRTVVDDSANTPIAGVTVKFLGKTDKGTSTGCTDQTVSDGGGNFLFSNLSSACVGPQLIAYDGLTATSPQGKYAGVDLSYTLVAGQVVTSPVLVHLPRIDNAEEVDVKQNWPTNQVFSFSSIPGLTATVYAGTTLSLDDGSQPNPFPLVAIQVPADRLPEKMASTGMVMPLIVAFQPANAVASQPVAVNFPNALNSPPGASVTFMTLDPTRGYMVPYGSGTASKDGTVFVADNDPAHPGHGYGLVHFDWHGPAIPPQPNGKNPSPDGCKLKGHCDPNPKNKPGKNGDPNKGCNSGGSGGGGGSTCNEGNAPDGGEPVDLASGLHVVSATDISISGSRGSISIERTYRGSTSNDGPFGLGGQFQYSWQLTSSTPDTDPSFNLVSPDGNQYPFSRQADGTLVCANVPWLQGAVMTTNSSHQTTLRLYDGTVYSFAPFRSVSALASVADANGNTVLLDQSITLGAVVRITRITDPVGRFLNLAYDGSAHVTSVTDAIGRKVTYTYNSSGALATVTDAMGGVTKYSYDGQNRLISMTNARNVPLFIDSYDTNGRIGSQLLPDGSVFNFTYVTSTPSLATSPVAETTVIDGRGNQTVYRFNAQGYVIGVTDALGQTRDFTRDPQTNQLLQATGSAQCAVCGRTGEGTVSYTYDTLGNRLTSTDALGNTTTYTYEPTHNKVASITDALKHSTSFTYDANGNLTKITDANGHTTGYAYDSNGLLQQITDALGNKTAIAYDGFGNPTTITDALSNTTTAVFDSVSRPVLTTDPVGRKSSVTYDDLNRVVSVTDGRGSTVKFEYDAVGNLLTLTDPKNNKTTFVYDSQNRVSTRTSPLGKSQTYKYDLAGNVSQFTDRRGQVSKFQFDALNRLQTATYQDSTVTMAYNAAGLLSAVTDSISGLFEYVYDARGRLLVQSGPTGVLRYTRDALGRVATEMIAGQNPVSYTYDPVGKMLSASNPSVGVTFAYDQRNLPTALSRTNGVVSTYTYDALGRVLSITHAKGANVLNSIAYAYGSDGTRSAVNNSLAQPFVTQSASGTVDVANELLTNGGTTYTHDENGNRLTETTAGSQVSYGWDSRNRLSTITDASGKKTSLLYDMGRNLLEVDRGGSSSGQSFIVDGLNNVVSLTDSLGLPVSILTGRSIDSHLASVDSSGSQTFGIADALGSEAGTTDGAGALSSKLSYDPFGQTVGTSSATLPFAYAGRAQITGNVYYNRARYYDATAGRFLSEDPTGFAAGGANLFSYGNNNPVTHVDPSGLSWWDAILEVGQDFGKEIAQDYAADQAQKAGEQYGSDIDCRYGLQNGTTEYVVDAGLAGASAYGILLGAFDAAVATTEVLAAVAAGTALAPELLVLGGAVILLDYGIISAPESWGALTSAYSRIGNH